MTLNKSIIENIFADFFGISVIFLDSCELFEFLCLVANLALDEQEIKIRKKLMALKALK